MHLKSCLLFFMFFASIQITLIAQMLSGKVLQAHNNMPVAGASVFISNTSKVTITNDKGEFAFNNFPSGTYDIVVTSIGFTAKVTSVNIAAISQPITILLAESSKMLEEVIVRNYEKNGWEKWGQFFIENFVGKHVAAQDCIIKNKNAIGFVFNKKQNILEAFANETLIIENKYLGYKINYTLTGFEFNFNTRIFYYQGYPLFTELKPKSKRASNKWLEHRADAYEGSIMHFMRSFYRNKLLNDGFEVRKLVKVENKAKKEMREKMKIRARETGVMMVNDSNKVLQQPDMLAFLDKNILPSDSFGYAIDSTTALLEFEHYLQVTYLHKKPPEEYYTGNNFAMNSNGGSSVGLRISSNSAPNSNRETVLISSIHFPNKIGVSVFSNGSYFNGKNMLTDGYWAFSEKLSTLLPLDYKPPVVSKIK